MRKRADLNRKNFEQMSVNQNNLMQLIYGMQDIKLLGCEQQKRWEWENIQASLFRINMSSLNLGQWQRGGSRTYQRSEKRTDNSSLCHRRTTWKHHAGCDAFHTVHHRTDARAYQPIRFLHAGHAGRDSAWNVSEKYMASPMKRQKAWTRIPKYQAKTRFNCKM